MKANGWTWVRILFNDGNAPSAWFNVATGAKGTVQGAGISSAIENIGGGFYRISATAPTPAVAGLVEIYLTGGDGPANINATPNGTDGIFIENVQVEMATAPTSRVLTIAAPATRNAETLTLTIPSGVELIRLTHDDASYTEKQVTPGAYPVPLLARPWIKTVAARPALPVTLAMAGTATSIPTLKSGTDMWDLNSVTRHYFPYGADWIDIGVANWFVNLGGSSLLEAGSGFPMSVGASVTLADGSIVQLKWGGAATGTIASGDTTYCDKAFVGIPAGSWVKINLWRRLVGDNKNLVGQTPCDTVNGEKLSTLNGGGNLSMTPGAITDNIGTAYRAPPAIIRGNVTGRSFALIGDSRTEGTQDAGASSDKGEIARALTNRFPYINLGVGNDRAVTFVASYAKRLALAAQCSDVVMGLGGNDLSLGRTAAQILADRATIKAAFTGKTHWAYTLPPFGVTSSDGFATLANQTVPAINAERVILNDTLRAGIAGVTTLEVADAVESSRNSGKWRVDLGVIAPDGIHENALGNQTIAAAISASIS